MIQNIFVFALLFVSAGVYGSTVAEKALPKAKDAHAIRKMTQQLMRKNVQAKHMAPLADIKAGKLKPLQHEPVEMMKAKTDASPKATLRGAHAGKVETESLTTAKTRLLSPNKGFLEYTVYDDAACGSAYSTSGSAVNYCYYDEDTEGASAEVVVLKKFSSGYINLVAHSLQFTDSSCTSLNTTSTVIEDNNSLKGNCYTTTIEGETWSFMADHVSSPTNVTSDTMFSYYEYKSESACNNWNANSVASYGSFTSDAFGCNEYFNEGEYFKVACSNSVAQVEIYSDDSCSTYLRTDDFSDMCSSEYFTFPTRLICESAV